MVDSLFENSLDIFLVVFYNILCMIKVFSFNLGQFSPQNAKISVTYIAPLIFLRGRLNKYQKNIPAKKT